MKTKRILLGLAFVMVASFLTTSLSAQKKMDLNLDKSKVVWTGKKVTGEHSGTVMLKSGNLMMKGTKIIGGEFVMDMGSIANTDITDEKYRGKLEEHLKSEDFFGVTKYPESKFVIKESKNLKDGKLLVKGEVSIKGITKPLEFEVNSHQHGDSHHMSGLIVIDRTQFDIKYGSGSFFDNLGDKTIHNNFELKFDLMF
ncbi:YceI family protein [Ancylomarina euxinus]|uniref:YceI family protein n=1 Tax=Ancylomarina euxinus TaxID=2283627 RepID=A0A425XZ42_9BACT|nr:YceI family protein [Ancylomarina euxinus]MCZ4695554.1 YceI family protein [Ancylomarina euxinus]MUP15935.1 YceI family protein [Ancylomarina euxinus]RRG20376.1 YceI family protein [Ancylomarina euxinus]